MTAHLFGGLGMMPFNITTDPGTPNFMQRAAAMIPGLILHGPFRDYNLGYVPIERDDLPDGDMAFFVGTSLSADDAFDITGRSELPWDGVFMFQASQYGEHAVATAKVKYAHLIYSENPLPLPGLGSFKPGAGPLIAWDQGLGGQCPAGANYILTRVDDPHPGNSNINSQMLFIGDMQRIIAGKNPVMPK